MQGSGNPMIQPNTTGYAMTPALVVNPAATIGLGGVLRNLLIIGRG